MSEATPRPWLLRPYTGHKPDFDWPGKIVGADGTEVYAGPFSFRSLGGKTEEEAEANAKLIVCAVNAHDTMAKALDDAAKVFALDAEQWDRIANLAGMNTEAVKMRANLLREQAGFILRLLRTNASTPDL